jgi:hypothetical protein
MISYFKKTSVVINQIDEFLDTVDQSSLIFIRGFGHYISKEEKDFAHDIQEIDEMESHADELRRAVETSLYSKSLIPEFRGDILQLLERIDDIIDNAKESLIQFDVERPEIPKKYHADFKELAETSGNAIEHLILSARSFFREPKAVKDMLHRVYFFEKEGDRSSNDLKRKIFRDKNLNLAEKQQLRHFASNIEVLSDISEGIADTLAILAIKRTI